MLATIISIISYISISSKGDRTERLELEIMLDKLAYRSNSPIPIYIKLKNTGETKVLVNGRMAVNYFNAPTALRDITFVLIGPDGEPVSFKAAVNIRPPREEDIVILLPQKTIERIDDIQTLYDMHKIGSYTIYAIYQNTFEADRNPSTWKGEITSNSIGFEITQ